MRYIQIKKQRSLHPDPLFHGKYIAIEVKKKKKKRQDKDKIAG